MFRVLPAIRMAAITLLASSAGCHHAAKPLAPPRAALDVEAQLLTIEKNIYRANNECDYAYFAYIEAEEFIFTGADGSVTTRAQDLASEKDCKKADYVIIIDEPRLQRYGDVAILNARLTVASPEGKTVRQARFTDVFVWRDGRW